jgi:colanic acid/amylovoran biosynthesis glycosyltransferase
MRIGICLSSAPSYSETFLVTKLKGLESAGHIVTVFLLGHSKTDHRFRYVTPYPFGKVGLIFWFPVVFLRLILFSSGRLSRFIRLERKHRNWLAVIKNVYINAHILPHHLEWIHFEFANIAFTRENIALAVGAKLSISLRGYDISIFPLKHPHCYDQLWKNVDRVHTISDDLYRLALLEGLSREKTCIKIKPAISFSEVKRKTNPGFIGDRIRVATTGRLEWKKGYYYALKAIKILKEKGVDIEYHIIGDGAQREELEFLIYDWGLRDSVKLLGRVDHQLVTQTICDYDLYLQPSIQEGFCNSLLEAQAAGLLCIATDAEGMSENVAHGVSGWIVPRKDFQAIADRIEYVLKLKQEERRLISEQAMKRVEREYDLTRLNVQFDEFYT